MPRKARPKRPPYNKTPFESAWIDEINALPSKKTRASMQSAFDTAFEHHGGKNEFHTPVKPSGSYGERWFIPKGLTPQKTPGKTKYTPRRELNPKRVKEGKAPYLVRDDFPTMKFDIEAHHITQGFDSDNVFIVRPFHRGAGTKKDLHPYKDSVVKPSHRKKHHDVRMDVLTKHFESRQLDF
jgi:hypothetical protein